MRIGITRKKAAVINSGISFIGKPLLLELIHAAQFQYLS